MGTNSSIDFYMLTLDNYGGNYFIRHCCNSGGWFSIPLFIAYKKDDEENGIMIDLLTGMEIYPKTSHPLPSLTYTDKRFASLDDLMGASKIIHCLKNGEQDPFIKYKEVLDKEFKKAQESYDKYSKCYNNITDYMYEMKPNL